MGCPPITLTVLFIQNFLSINHVDTYIYVCRSRSILSDVDSLKSIVNMGIPTITSYATVYRVNNITTSTHSHVSSPSPSWLHIHSFLVSFVLLNLEIWFFPFSRWNLQIVDISHLTMDYTL